MNALVSQMNGKYDFIGLSLSSDGVAEFTREHDTAFPVYLDVSSETVSGYGLGTTPQTIVVAAEGKILANWRGAYLGQVRSEVQKFFGVRLPEQRAEQE